MNYILDLCKDCENAVKDEELIEAEDDNNQDFSILTRNRFNRFPLHDLRQRHLNHAFLNELKLGIHNWKRGLEVNIRISQFLE